MKKVDLKSTNLQQKGTADMEEVKAQIETI